MKFVIAAGGTAGHINPALALAKKLEEDNHEVIFAGTPNRLESKLVPSNGFEFVPFNAKGFNRKQPWTLITASFLMLKNTNLAKKWLLKEKPNAVIGFGCYVSIAICNAAKKLEIPYIIHEQNSVMGMSNKFLSKHANATCLTYEKAKLPQCKNPIITGNPVRKEIINTTKEKGRKFLNVPNDVKVLLIFGGSLGASKLNSVCIDSALELLEKYENLYVIQVSGKSNYEDCKKALKLDSKNKNRWMLLDYSNDMQYLLAACDFCLCRAGASTLAEITALKIPSILIPYPYATENHQYYNAQTLFENECALYINEKDFSKDSFIHNVSKFLDDQDFTNQTKDSFSNLKTENSVEKLAQQVYKFAK